jgi:DNA-binding NarL/FixJ family response regulator
MQSMEKAGCPQSNHQTSLLLVAAHSAFRDVTVRLLERYDELLILDKVWGNEQCLARAEKLRPQVILFDMDISGRSGLETISNLRAMLPEVGIIALSMLDVEEYRRAVLAAGADDMILKANLSTELVPTIRRVARSGANGREPMYGAGHSRQLTESTGIDSQEV